MNINKYVKQIYIDSETICMYNTLNASIVELSVDYIDKDGNLNEEKFSENELAFLYESYFLDVDQDYINNQINNAYKNNTKGLDITIELTMDCNLKCKYCYQNDFTKRKSISYTTIDKILKYIDIVTKKRNIEYIKLTYIGGEPLLAKNELEYSYKIISEFCDQNDILLKTSLNSNLTLLNKGNLDYFKNIEIPLTLSLPNDHDIVRPTKDGHPTFNTIIKNLKNNKGFFKREDVFLIIRYNTNKNNINMFGNFLDYLETLDLNISEVYAMYTDEYPQNNFINGLTKEEFTIWNSTIAIDNLIEKNYKIYYMPKNTFIPCKAYVNDNCKFYADGFTGLCDAWDYNLRGPHIDLLLSDKDIFNNHFNEIKNWNPLKDNNCKECADIIICGGKYFCREDCKYDNIYKLDNFIKKYIEYQRKGKDHFFPFMKDSN